jgi:mono/diheme cytochrome c family protein
MTNITQRIGRVRVSALALSLLLPLGCQQEMGRQPYYRPLEKSTFYADGRSARPLVPGTVAQGQFQGDQLLFTGKNTADTSRAWADQAGALVGFGANGPWSAALAAPALLENVAITEYASVFPFPVNAEVLERGQQRFTIFCSVCHDSTGRGNGKIVQRGYTHPPSYITDYSRGFEHRGIKVRLRDVPVGYLFEVVSKGYGAMADYAAQVPPRDRWAIIAYIRALQLSQYAPLDELPEKERLAVRTALEGKP